MLASDGGNIRKVKIARPSSFSSRKGQSSSGGSSSSSSSDSNSGGAQRRPGLSFNKQPLLSSKAGPPAVSPPIREKKPSSSISPRSKAPPKAGKIKETPLDPTNVQDFDDDVIREVFGGESRPNKR